MLVLPALVEDLLEDGLAFGKRQQRLGRFRREGAAEARGARRPAAAAAAAAPTASGEG